VDDYIKSIKAHLYDRATSPLFGTFAVSWFAWNYRFVVVLLVSMPVRDKFEFVSEVLYTTWFDRLGPGFLCPLATSLGFIYLYPILARPVYRYVRQQQKEMRAIKQQIEDETPLTLEESRVLRNAAFSRQRELEKQIEEKNAAIHQLKAVVTKLETELAKGGPHDPHVMQAERRKSGPELSEDQIRLLQLTAQLGRADEEVIIKNLGEARGRIRVDFDLGELVRLELVEKGVYGSGSVFYVATHEGRAALIRMGKG
jgi:hypothetical protein